MTQAEILYGLEILPKGKRRDVLTAAAISMFKQDFSEQILPFNTDAAKLLANTNIAAKRKKIGLPTSQIDAQIAAIALFHNASLATRNTKDFEEYSLSSVNPWK